MVHLIRLSRLVFDDVEKDVDSRVAIVRRRPISVKFIGMRKRSMLLAHLKGLTRRDGQEAKTHRTGTRRITDLLPTTPSTARSPSRLVWP